MARLQQYWAAQGCAVWVPHNSEARHSQPRLLQGSSGASSWWLNAYVMRRRMLY